MISSRFENTKPINLILVFTALIFGLFLYEIFIFDSIWNLKMAFERLLNAFLLFFSLFFLTKIDHRNELTEDNSYSIFFFAIFCVIFPQIYQKTALLVSNLFIIISIWRIISLQHQENISQKIFDASFLIVCAAIFNVFAIFFLLNIWISLLYYGSQKLKYWLIPSLAIFCIAVLVYASFILLKIPFSFDYFFTGNISKAIFLPELVAFCLTMLMLFVSVAVYFFKRKYHSGSSQVIIQFLLVGLGVLFLSKEPIFIFAQLSILFALYIEKIEKIRWKEGILWLFLSIPILILILYLTCENVLINKI